MTLISHHRLNTIEILKEKQKSRKDAWLGKLGKIQTNCIWANLKNVEPTFSSLFEKMMSFSFVLNQDLEQGKLMAAVDSRK